MFKGYWVLADKKNINDMRYIRRAMGNFVFAARALWLFVPAFIANPSAVLFGGILPIDFGKNFIDGRRLLGDGKTYSGLIGGVLSGVFIGLIQLAVGCYLYPEDCGGFGEFPSAMKVLIAMALGSLVGDLGGSFIKRRLGMKRGEKCPLLDQYDFVAGAFLFLYMFDKPWLVAHYFSNNGVGIMAVIVVTPLLHKAVNIVGYKSGLKNVPW